MKTKERAETAKNIDGIQTLCTKREIAQLLSVSLRSVDNYIATGLIPFIKLGRSVRFDPREVIAAIKGQD